MASPLAYDLAPYRSTAYLQGKRRELTARVFDCEAGKTCAICQRAREAALREIDQALTKAT